MVFGIGIIKRMLDDDDEEERKSIAQRVKDRVNKEARTSRTILNGHLALNPTVRFVDACVSMTVKQALRRLKKGDHVKCNRTVYSHHGIYDGEGWVYEYNEGEIRRVPLKYFADGDSIIRVDSPCSYFPEEIIRRAASRLNEHEYRLIDNNCEHYARWCRDGEFLE